MISIHVVFVEFKNVQLKISLKILTLSINFYFIFPPRALAKMNDFEYCWATDTYYNLGRFVDILFFVVEQTLDFLKNIMYRLNMWVRTLNCY